MTCPGWDICVKRSARSSLWPGSVFGECTSHARLVMTGSMLPVACGPLHCLFGEWCSAVKCWPSWQRFHCPFGRRLGLVRASPASQTGIQWAAEEKGGGARGLTEERNCWLSTLVLGQARCQEETKVPSLTSRSSRLCGDWDLSLHLKGKQHPTVICLSNLIHRTAMKTLQIHIFFSFPFLVATLFFCWQWYSP